MGYFRNSCSAATFLNLKRRSASQARLFSVQYSQESVCFHRCLMEGLFLSRIYLPCKPNVVSRFVQDHGLQEAGVASCDDKRGLLTFKSSIALSVIQLALALQDEILRFNVSCAQKK